MNQVEIFDDTTMQAQRDEYANVTIEQVPLDMRRNSPFAHAGDVAFPRGRAADVPVVICWKRGKVAGVIPLGQKNPQKRHYNISSLWVPAHGYRLSGYATLYKARTTLDKDQRWLVDTHTGEMLRVANLYDVWILEAMFFNQLAAVRLRFRLVDGNAWMTGDELDVLRAEKARRCQTMTPRTDARNETRKP